MSVEVNKEETARLRKAAAVAAQIRFDQEEARKKEAKAKHQRAKEAAKEQEENEIMAMKTAAAMVAEVLETKQAVKSSVAKEAARLAAEERAERVASMSKEYLPEKHHVERNSLEKKTVTETCDIDDKTRHREAMARAQQAREAARKAEDEKIETMKREAATKSEQLEKKESIRSSQAREAARLAAEMRAGRKDTTTNASTVFTPSSLSYWEEVKKMETAEEKKTGCDQKDMKERDNMKELTPTIGLPNTASHGKEIVNVMQTKHKLREVDEDNDGGTKYGNFKEEKSRWRETQEEMRDPILDYYNKTQGGARAKESNDEYTQHSGSNKAAQNSTVPMTSPELKQRYNYSSERDVVSVRECPKSESRELRGRHEEELNRQLEWTKGGRMNAMTEENHKHKYGERETVSVTDQKTSNESNRKMEYTRRTAADIPEQDQDVENRRATSFDLPKMNRGYEQQQQHSHSFNSRNKQTPPKPHQHSSRQHVTKGRPAHDPRILICISCNGKYNFKEKLPRSLYCGHPVCTVCIGTRTNPDSSVTCPYCPKETYNIRNPRECPIDEHLLDLLSKDLQQTLYEREREDSSYGGNDRRQSHHEHWSGSSFKREDYRVQPKSPHGSACYEMGVRPSCYCLTCKLWVCTRCAELDHNNQKCTLKPLKDQLSDMKHKYDLIGQNTKATLDKCLQSLVDDIKTDDVFTLWMNAIFEGMEERQENSKSALEQGRNLMSTFRDVMKGVEDAHNLPEALAAFEILDTLETEANKWSLRVALDITGEEETSACIKFLLKRTLKSFMDQDGRPALCATDKTSGGEFFSQVQMDGGRFHLPALAKQKSTSRGKMKILPVQCFISSQNSASTLVFLDLWWSNMTRGRVYIRLTGDTVRGRQFISLCTGERGVSLSGTPFHRVWWKGKAGEHVWTGDIEKGDGSGGRTFDDFSSKQSHIPKGREVPVSAGLVAGRYEKDVSSIFRIYTRESKGDKDEEGFGQVEFGLDVVKEAVMVKDISEVIISGCGLVLEM